MYVYIYNNNSKYYEGCPPGQTHDIHVWRPILIYDTCDIYIYIYIYHKVHQVDDYNTV